MNRKVKSYKGRNDESSSQQLLKEQNNLNVKNLHMSNFLDRRRRVFDGSREEKKDVREEYKQNCDIHMRRKNILTETLKKTEKEELARDKEIMEQRKQNEEERDYLKRVYQKNLQEDNKQLHLLSQTNQRYEKLMDIHQDLQNLKNDYFSRNLTSYR